MHAFLYLYLVRPTQRVQLAYINQLAHSAIRLASIELYCAMETYNFYYQFAKFANHSVRVRPVFWVKLKVALAGPSGVGKSTITNLLHAGEPGIEEAEDLRERHMDEALVLCAVDLCGRPYFAMEFDNGRDGFASPAVGEFDTQLVKEFFYSISYAAAMNLHFRILAGENDHHIIEAMFKAFSKALDMATGKDPRIEDVLSTKGCL